MPARKKRSKKKKTVPKKTGTIRSKLTESIVEDLNRVSRLELLAQEAALKKMLKIYSPNKKKTLFSYLQIILQKSPDKRMRHNAAKFLLQNPTKKTVEILKNSALKDGSHFVRETSIISLAEIPNSGYIETAKQMLFRDRNPSVKQQCAHLISKSKKIPKKEKLKILNKALEILNKKQLTLKIPREIDQNKLAIDYIEKDTIPYINNNH